jgi:tripartite-type tricarboxylate transporter receptor subunit TctC
VIDYLYKEVAKALESPEVKENLAAQGMEPYSTTPEEFARILRDDTKRWADAIRAANIKVE